MSTTTFISRVAPLFAKSLGQELINDPSPVHAFLKFELLQVNVTALFNQLMNEHRTLSTDSEQLLSLLFLDALVELHQFPSIDLLNVVCVPYLNEEMRLYRTAQRYACVLIAKYMQQNIESDTVKKILDQVKQKIGQSLDLNANNEDLEVFDHLLVYIDLLSCLFENGINLPDFEDDILSLLLKAIKTWPSAHRKQTIMNVLTPVIKKNATKERLTTIWQTVGEMVKLGKELKAESYSILCQLYEQFFSVEGDSYKFDLRSEEAFWLMILDGLFDEDTFTKKRCIYLLKRVIDMTKNNPKIKPSHWTRYFSWDPANTKSLMKQWDTFFMLYDTLDQFSQHLLQSTWSQILIMFPKRGEKGVYLDFAWIRLLLLRSFGHTNYGIARNTIIRFLSIDLKEYELFFDSNFITEDLFQFLSTSRILLLKERIGEKFRDFLVDYFEALRREESEAVLAASIKKLLNNLRSRNGTRLTPAYILNSMTQIQSGDLLDDESVEYLIEVYERYYRDDTSWVQFRGGNQIIQTIVRLGNSQKLNQTILWKFISALDHQVFDSKTRQELSAWFLARGENQVLQDLSGLLVETFDKDTMVLATIYAERFARLLYVVFLSQEALLKLLEPLFHKIHTIYSHTYVEELMPYKVCLIVSNLLSELDRSEHAIQLVKQRLSEDLEELVSFIKLKLPIPEFSSTTKHDSLQLLDRVYSFSSLVTQLNIHFNNSDRVKSLNESIVPVSVGYFSDLSKRQSKDTQAFSYEINTLTTAALEYIHSLVLPHFSKQEALTNDQYSSLLQIAYKVPILSTRVKQDSDSGEYVTKKSPAVLKEAFEAKWKVISELLEVVTKSNLLTDADLHKDLLSDALDAVDTLSTENVIYAIDSIRLLLPLALQKGLIESDDVERYAEAMLVASRAERQRFECMCVASVTAMLFTPVVIRKAHDYVQKYVIQILRISETAPRNAYPLAFQAASILVSNDEDLKVEIADIVIKLISFDFEGDEDDDGESFEYALSTCNYSQSEGVLPVAIRFNKFMRAQLIYSCLRLQGNRKFVGKICSLALKRLLDKDMNKTPCMPNSTVHRVKLRLLQMLIVLSQYIDQELFDSLKLNEILWTILIQANMNSVRRLLELFTVSVCFRFPEAMVASMAEKLKSDFNARAQYISSLIAVAGNFVLYSPESKFPSLVKQILPLIVMYATMHQYAVRIMAHIMYVQIWARISTLTNSEEIEELRSNSMWRAQLDLLQHFFTKSDSCKGYFEKYKDIVTAKIVETSKPDNLFAKPFVEGTNIVNDHIPSTTFNVVQKRLTEFFTSAFNVNSKLLTCHKFRIQSLLDTTDTLGVSWTELHKSVNEEESYASLNPFKGSDLGVIDNEVKNADLPLPFRELEETHKDEVINFQKKIVPWTDLELENEINPREQRATKERQSVIVMASLIEKIPNLAGLSRTCEIFQAEKLVLSSKKIMQTDDFKGISVTSERWLPVDECMEVDIPAYLKQKKEEGYAILGVEQTSSSVSIDHFTFPKRCVLVLGKEKEGIPTELINMIDTCVEIPQLGMIRSLNVHVTGSIMLYEYTRQNRK